MLVLESPQDSFAASVAPRVPVVRAVQRWRYARSRPQDLCVLWDAVLMLGVCGDWLLGETVESAWLSGTCLAQQMTGFSDPLAVRT